MAPWFFLSYSSHDEGERRHVTKFFTKLAEAVAPKVDMPKEQVGFLDQSIRLGQRWEPEMVEALRTCRTMLCLLSPGYLNSDWCGKELQVFLERIEKLGSPPLLLPILWERPRDVLSSLPPALRKMYITWKEFGTDYEEKGLSFLVRLRRHTKFTLILADYLVTVAQHHPLPEANRIPNFSKVRNAFSAGVSSDVGRGPQLAAPGVHPRRLPPHSKRTASKPNKSRSSCVVTLTELGSSRERLDEEVFAIQLLKRPIKLERDNTGQVTVTINRNGVREILLSNQAKMLKTKQMVTPERRSRLLSIDRQIHTFLAEGGPEGSFIIDLPNLDINLRWASGGILSIITIMGKKWVPLFFRDIRPYGWNTALGTTERWFTKRSGYRKVDPRYSLVDDLDQPLDFILREFLEEVLIVRGRPREQGVLYHKKFQFPEGVSAISKARATQFYEDHCRLRREEDHLEIKNPASRVAEVVFRNPNCSLKVVSNSRYIVTPGILICFSLLDLGIEVVRVAEYELEEGDWILDGEIKETYQAATRKLDKVLVRMPTALLSLDYLREIFGKGQEWQRYTFGPQPSIKVPRAPDPHANEIRFFDWDIKRRMEAVEGEWDAKSMASRYLDWYDKFSENFIADRRRPRDKWQRQDGNASRLFVPGTAKALNLYFRRLEREETK